MKLLQNVEAEKLENGIVQGTFPTDMGSHPRAHVRLRRTPHTHTHISLSLSLFSLSVLPYHREIVGQGMFDTIR